MSEQEAVWYYSQHGERKGPVTLDVLKSAIERDRLDRDKDLVWGPGLANWSKVSEVPELKDVAVAAPAPEEVAVPPAPPVEEKASAKPLSTQPASAPVQSAKPAAATTEVAKSTEKLVKAAEPKKEQANPYQTPNTIDDDNELADAMAARRMKEGSGVGIGRLKYFFYPILVSLLIGLLGGLVVGGLSASLPEVAAIVLIAIYVISGLASIYFIVARLHNLSMSGWAIFWFLVPFMNFWVSWRLSCCPAEYAKHKKLDTAGKVMTTLFVIVPILLVVVSILFVGADAYREAALEAQRAMEAQEAGSTQ